MMTTAKRLAFLPQLGYVPSVPFLSRPFCSGNPSLNDDVETVFRIISSSTSSKNLVQSLKSSGVFLSNDLIDKVLKRVRFMETLYRPWSFSITLVIEEGFITLLFPWIQCFIYLVGTGCLIKFGSF